jgi:hypothetical protein
MEESFCALQQSTSSFGSYHYGSNHGEPSTWDNLSTTSRDFLVRLDLPSIHPQCCCWDYSYNSTMIKIREHNTSSVSSPSTSPFVYRPPSSQWHHANDNNNNNTMALPPPPMGPAPIWNSEEPILEALITLFYMVVPPTFCLVCLWIRLVSGFLAPIGLLYLAVNSIIKASSCRCYCCSIHCGNQKEMSTSTSSSSSTSSVILWIITVVCSLIVMTDSAYVLEFGPAYGISLFGSSIVLALPVVWCGSSRRRRLWITYFLLLLFGLALYLTVDNRTTLSFRFGYTPEDAPSNVKEGIYYDSSNDFLSRVIQGWPEDTRTYSTALGATRWMMTGDARTGLPYLMNTVPNPHWHRVWIPVSTTEEEGEDDQGKEYLALDISFPTTTTAPDSHDRYDYDSSKPLYLVFHGLNGGSNDGYVKDLAVRCNAEGSTVIVMVARGIMDTPVRGWTVRTPEKKNTPSCPSRISFLTCFKLLTWIPLFFVALFFFGLFCDFERHTNI